MNNNDLYNDILYEEFINRAYSKSGLPLPHAASANGALFNELIVTENSSILTDKLTFSKILKIVKDCMENAFLGYLTLPVSDEIRIRIYSEYELFQSATTSKELLDIMILVLNLTD